MNTYSKIPKRNNRSPITILATILITSVFLSGCSPSQEKLPLPKETTEGTISTAQESSSNQLGDYYTPRGLLPEGRLLVYSDHSLDSSIVGEISLGATGISINEIFSNGTIQWAKIEYHQLAGWVDFNALAAYKGGLPEELLVLSQQTLTALKNMDLDRIDELIHPEICLRISPYPFLADNNQYFCPDEIQPRLASDVIYTWGNFDGTGEPIQMTFAEYYQRFIYDVDYIQAPIVGLNIEVSSGNAINNIPDFFPDGKMIEYYFPGFDPKYGGMDWRSLRLVFVNVEGNWYLGAIIHGEWTI